MSSDQSSSATLDDNRKRKLENDDENCAQVKIAKPSLGLSLLQSYDAEDDYMTSDEEPTSPSSKLVDSSVTRNVFIEEMTDEDQADENLPDHISSVNLETADVPSSSVLETNELSADTLESSVPVRSNIEETVTPVVEKSVDEPIENLIEVSANEVCVVPDESPAEVNESVDIKTSSFDAKIETEPVSADKDSVDDLKLNTIKQTDETVCSETSDSKNVQSFQTSVTIENESNPDIRPDYNFSVFGTSSDVGSSDERISSKPAKKVKLNRSKFVRSVDESSNEARSSAVTSSPVLLSSSESDSKPVVHEDFVTVKPKVEVAEIKVCVSDQRTEISVKSDETVVNVSDKIENSDLDREITPMADENISVEVVSIGQSVTDSDVSVEAVDDLKQTVSEPLVTKDLPSDFIEENVSLVEGTVAQTLENVPQSAEEMAEPESPTAKIDSVLVDEEIVGPTDVLRDENYDNSHDDMIEVIDQDFDDYSSRDEKQPDSDDGIVEELKTENENINFIEEVKLSELDATEEFKNDEAPMNIAEDLDEKSVDNISIVQASTEGMFVEEVKDESAVIEELTDANAIVEDIDDRSSFIEELEDESSVVEEAKQEDSANEESNENPIIDSVEEVENKNLFVDADDSKDEKTEASPISFDAPEEHSLDSDENPDEGDENEPVASTVEVRNTSEPPHRPLKIIIRKKEEKLVIVEGVQKSKRRGRKSAKKLQKEKSKTKEESKKRIVETDERVDSEMNIVGVEEVAETFKETNEEFESAFVSEKTEVSDSNSENISIKLTIKKTDDAEMKSEVTISADPQIFDPTTSQPAQIAVKPCPAAESDEEIFRDAMDTLEPVSSEMNFENQTSVSGLSDPEQSSLPNSETVVESVVSTAFIDAEFDSNEVTKSTKNDQPKPVEESNSDGITDQPMEVDVDEASAKAAPETPSKLEQALTRKLRSDKNEESAAATTPVQETSEIEKTASETPPIEPPPVKENLKLHLSVQGNRVSIKKNVAAEAIAAPLPETTAAPLPSPAVEPEAPPPRVKRQYRKRPKPTIDPALLTEEKSYTLRTRTTKNPPEDVTPKKTKGRKSAAVIAASATEVTVPEQTPLPVTCSPPKKEKVLREAPLPVTVEIDPPPDKKVTTPAGKVRPIRLKIKNPGVTIECTSKYSPVTIEKIGGPEKGAMSENIVGILEEARKKEAQSVVTEEQPAWSGTDLQRVERLLKESNITITPVSSAPSSSSSAEPVSPSPHSILKPILTAVKEKSTRKLHKAPPVSPSSSSTIGGASITPIYGDSKDTLTDSSYTRNLNVTLKPLDFEEQLSHWKISKPGREMDVTRIPSPAVDQSKQQPVDVKLEIRKKIASSERRRQIQEPEVVITVDEPTPNLEEVHQSRTRVEGASESKPPIKQVRRKSRSRPVEITIIKPSTEVIPETKNSVEEITRRLSSKPLNADEFILPDSTPPVVEVTEVSVPSAKEVVQESEAVSSFKQELKAPAALESQAEVQVILDPTVVPEAVSAPNAGAQVASPPQADISEVVVKPEIEIVEHIIHPTTEQDGTESTVKVENVEPVAEPGSEIRASGVEHEPAEASTEVKLEAPVSSVCSAAGDVSPATKPETTAPPPSTAEVKLTTPEPKPKTGKQMPDLLPINKPAMTLKAIQIPRMSTQLGHVSTPTQSQLASTVPPATPASPPSGSAVPQSPVTQQPAIPPHFVPLMPQIKLNVAPLTPKMLQDALAGPQGTPSASFTDSPMSAMSMTPSCTPRMADSSINTSARSFTDSATPSFSNLPPLIFPKKRGRPTKAMVAAREAYRQSQEAMGGFKPQNFEQVPTTTDVASTPQSMPPSDESSMSNMSVDLMKIPVKRGRKIKLEKSEQTDGSDENTLAEKLPMDPEREMEELKRLEEDRVRKEQERERKNELRRQKAKERSDLEKAKKLRQRQKAEERHRKVQEQRRLLQEQKKKLEEEIKKLPGFEAGGRVTTADVPQMSNGSFLIDDDSNSTSFDMMQRLKKTKMEVYDPDGNNLTVDQIAEYQWPIQGGELYMIQEQISNFLGVKSFKRKYPDIKRRPVDSEERAYLVDSGLVSETLCDLGITAVCSAEVLDIMCSDFSEKYEELRKHMREKQMKELSFKQKAWANGLGYKLLMADGSKQDLKKRAMESVSNWNSALNKSRHEDRRSAIDLQTFIIHYPKSKTQNMTTPSPKIGSFPISILPGQFCDFYKDYTSTELRYMPLNTVIYGPLKHPSAAKDVDGSQTDSDDSSSSDESSSTTSEDTQGTEDTLEDTDKDMSLDESLLAEKLPDTSVREDRDTNRREMANGVTEASSQENGKTLCKICLGDESRNKENAPEVLIYCSQCCSSSHPTCLDLSLIMVPHIKSYKWQCPDCKNCARCKEYADEDKMLFCDICDRGYHIYCVGLKKVPSGSWQCHECSAVDDQVSRENSTFAPNLPTSIPIKIES